MAVYIPLRSLAGGYHAKTPLRCYIFSVIMLIIVSNCVKYLSIADLLCFFVLTTGVLVVILLSHVEDKNKPLGKTEHSIYKRRVIFITISELTICLLIKLVGLDYLFVAVVYSFTVLSIMLIVGKIKNTFITP